MDLRCIEFRDDALYLLDQRILPHKTQWVRCKTMEESAQAIENMTVRGAPAIGCAAAYGLLLDVLSCDDHHHWQTYKSQFQKAIVRLKATRPTAVNLFFALDQFQHLSDDFREDLSISTIKRHFRQLADRLLAEDLATCRAIGKTALTLTDKQQLKIITHCNAGALATAGYGTALGVIRAFHEQGRVTMVFVDETRPFWQGSRLTAYELLQEQIPCTLIVDSAAAFVMQRQSIDFVVVGADRIAANGDVANKIGTYALALAASFHQVPFYVAAPLSTFDFDLRDGAGIVIEERKSKEISHIYGEPLAPEGIAVYNPSFDVTPARLISGIICEKGILRPPFFESMNKARFA